MEMKKIVIVAGCLLVTSMAQAEEINWKPVLTLAVAKSADSISSVRFSHNGSTCTERNLMFRNTDGTFNAAKGWMMNGVIVASAAGLQKLTSHGPKWLRRGMDFAVYGMSVRPTQAAVRNVINCGW